MKICVRTDRGKGFAKKKADRFVQGMEGFITGRNIRTSFMDDPLALSILKFAGMTECAELPWEWLHESLNVRSFLMFLMAGKQELSHGVGQTEVTAKQYLAANLEFDIYALVYS